MSKLLLLEDDESLIDGLRYSLEKNGFVLDVACSLMEARERLKGHHFYDLLLLDVTLPDGSGFAGGTGTSDLLLHNLVHLAGLSVEDAVKSMSATPARILKLNRKGILQQGYDADLTVFNSDLQIEMTIVNGQILYHRN